MTGTLSAVLFLLACTQADDSAAPEDKDVYGSVLLSDLRGNEWAVASLPSAEVQSEFSLSTVEPGVCEGEENLVYCLLFESNWRLAADGVKEVDFTYSVLDVSDGDDNGANDLLSRVVAVDAGSGAKRWGFRYLDFSGVSSTCPYDPEDPCHPPETLSPSETWACSMHMAHTVVVTGETDADVAMWVVDSRNSRLLHVTAPKDGDCAVVDTVVDRPSNPDWDVYNSVNSMQRSEVDGEMTLLMSVKGSFVDALTGTTQDGGESRGKIVLWTEAPTPTQIWEYPPESETETSFFNTPHGVQWLERPNGERWVVFANSLAANERDWGIGHGGSVGVLRITDSGPEYLYDAILHPDQGTLQFPRDVTPLPDGRVMVTDSGCLGDNCPYETAVWILDLPDAEPTGRSGVWSREHEDQAFVTVKADRGPYFQSMNLLYSAAWESDQAQ